MARGVRQAGHSPSLAAALIHFDMSFLCWVLVGALGAYIAADLGLSPTQKGLMVAVPPLGGAGFRLLLGTFALAMVPVTLAWVAFALLAGRDRAWDVRARTVSLGEVGA